MKKLFVIAASCFALWGIAQENNTWRVGVQAGWQANGSQFSGGMQNANARFVQSPFGAWALDFIGRYDLNNHWMWMTGLNFNSVGSEFLLAEDYSFTQKSKRFSSVKSSFPAMEIPLMAFYKFNPNCKNVRWFIGGGIAGTFISKQTIDKDISQSNDGASTTSYLSSTSVSKGGAYLQARWAIGREKTFKWGGILNTSVVFNLGFTEMIHSTVNYTVDGNQYNHEFSNRGDYIGFRFAYFFRPLKFKNNAKVKPATTPKITSN